MGSDYCQMAAKLCNKRVDISRKDVDDHEPQPKRQAQGNLNLPPKYFACPPFWLFCTLYLVAKFNNRGSPRDKTLQVKGGYLLSLIERWPS